MTDTPHPTDRFFGLVLGQLWTEAEAMVVAGEVSAWHGDFLRGSRLVSEGDPIAGVHAFRQLRQSIEAEIAEMDEDEDTSDLESFARIVESNELGAAFVFGLCNPAAKARIEARLDEIFRQLCRDSKEAFLKKIRQSERLQSIPPLMLQMVESSTLVGAMASYFAAVEAAPELVRQPALLRASGFGALHYAASLDPHEANPVAPMVKCRISTI